MKGRGHTVKNICLGTAISTIIGVGVNHACVQFVLDQQQSNSIVDSGIRIAAFAVMGVVFGAVGSLKEPEVLKKASLDYEDSSIHNSKIFSNIQQEIPKTLESKQQKKKKKTSKSKRMSKRAYFITRMQYFEEHPEEFFSLDNTVTTKAR